MPKKSLRLAAVLLGAFGVYLWLSYVRDQTEQQRAVTVYSRGKTSLSLFREWKAMARGQTVAMHHEAFLFPSRLTAFDGIMLASPRRPATPREAEVLAEYVAQGGRLILSAHDRGAYGNLHSVLMALGIHNAVEDHPGFTNQQLTMVSASGQTELFQPGNAYGFYSLIRFAAPPCQRNALACFAREHTVGQGRVLLTLGLPLPANTMLRHASNLDFTVSLGQWAPRLLIDEYHHFFTQKTWKDLLLRADVAVPLGGMLAGLVLFFLYGSSRWHEQRLWQAPRARPYHVLNENVLQQFLQKPALAGEALDMQRQWLQRLFPDQSAAIEALARQAGQRPGTLAQGLDEVIRFHRAQLIRRGRRGNA